MASLVEKWRWKVRVESVVDFTVAEVEDNSSKHLLPCTHLAVANLEGVGVCVGIGVRSASDFDTNTNTNTSSSPLQDIRRSEVWCWTESGRAEGGQVGRSAGAKTRSGFPLRLSAIGGRKVGSDLNWEGGRPIGGGSNWRGGPIPIEKGGSANWEGGRTAPGGGPIGGGSHSN